jgi:hypothetical protein
VTGRRIHDPDRPVCPVCNRETAVYCTHGEYGRRYRCNGCGARGTAERFAELALAHADAEIPAAIPLPTVLDPAPVRPSSRRPCERCFSLLVCRDLEREGRPVQCEATGRVWVGGVLCEV